MDPDEIKKMIVKDLDLQGMSPELQDQIIDQFSENALKRVTLALFERLPEEGKAEFLKLGDAGDSDGLLKMFQRYIPDMNAVVQSEIKDELAKFKEFQAEAK